MVAETLEDKRNMPLQIPFGKKLQQQLSDMLEGAGFQLVEIVAEPFESLRYEREKTSDLKPDVITFHGLEKNYPNSIYATAATSVGGGFFLKNLKELLANYSNLSVQEADKWSYSNDDELEICLTEIGELIKNNLLKWFDAPTHNNIDSEMSIRSNMSMEELEANLREQIRIFELALERARSEGRANDIERYERTIKEVKNKLSEINPDVK